MIAIFNRLKALKGLLVAGFVIVSLWTMATPAHAADMYGNERGQKQTTERYDKIQSEEGGMNNFNDVDPRRDANEAKAQTLIDTANRRKTQTSDPLEPAREAVGDLKEEVAGAADKATDAVSNKTNELTDKAGRVADRAGDKAGRAADRVGDKASRATDRLTDKAGRAANRSGDKLQRSDYQLDR